MARHLDIETIDQIAREFGLPGALSHDEFAPIDLAIRSAIRSENEARGRSSFGADGEREHDWDRNADTRPALSIFRDEDLEQDNVMNEIQLLIEQRRRLRLAEPTQPQRADAEATPLETFHRHAIVRVAIADEINNVERMLIKSWSPEAKADALKEFMRNEIRRNPAYVQALVNHPRHGLMDGRIIIAATTQEAEVLRVAFETAARWHADPDQRRKGAAALVRRLEMGWRRLDGCRDDGDALLAGLKTDSPTSSDLTQQYLEQLEDYSRRGLLKTSYDATMRNVRASVGANPVDVKPIDLWLAQERARALAAGYEWIDRAGNIVRREVTADEAHDYARALQQHRIDRLTFGVRDLSASFDQLQPHLDALVNTYGLTHLAIVTHHDGPQLAAWAEQNGVEITRTIHQPPKRVLRAKDAAAQLLGAKVDAILHIGDLDPAFEAALPRHSVPLIAHPAQHAPTQRPEAGYTIFVSGYGFAAHEMLRTGSHGQRIAKTASQIEQERRTVIANLDQLRELGLVSRVLHCGSDNALGEVIDRWADQHKLTTIGIPPDWEVRDDLRAQARDNPAAVKTQLVDAIRTMLPAMNEADAKDLHDSSVEKLLQRYVVLKRDHDVLSNAKPDVVLAFGKAAEIIRMAKARDMRALYIKTPYEIPKTEVQQANHLALEFKTPELLDADQHFPHGSEIRGFRSEDQNDPRRKLSTFAPVRVMFDGYQYRSVAHAFAAAGVPANRRRDVARPFNPAEAKRDAQQITDAQGFPAGWTEEHQIALLYDLTAQKFGVGTSGTRADDIQQMRDALLATGRAALIDDNYWRDTLMGVYQGEGRNIHGRMLELLRADLRREEIDGAKRLMATSNHGWYGIEKTGADGDTPVGTLYYAADHGSNWQPIAKNARLPDLLQAAVAHNTEHVTKHLARETEAKTNRSQMLMRALGSTQTVAA